MRKRLLFAIVSLTLLMGAVTAASAVDASNAANPGTRHEASIVRGHETNVVSSAATGLRGRRLGLFGALLGLLALLLAAIAAARITPRTSARSHRERSHVRRRGPPALLVA